MILMLLTLPPSSSVPLTTKAGQKYKFSDAGSDASKSVARKKTTMKKENDKEEDKDKEKAKEEEVLGKLSDMALDAAPSKEPLPKSSTNSDVSTSGVVPESKESLPGPLVGDACDKAGSKDDVTSDAEPLPTSEVLDDRSGEVDFDPMDDGAKANEELVLQSSSAPDKDVSMTYDVKKTSLPSDPHTPGASQTLRLCQLLLCLLSFASLRFFSPMLLTLTRTLLRVILLLLELFLASPA